VTITGIIPAAGSGSRWGGFYKEFLPVGNGEWLINRNINAMKLGGADKIVVISSPEKISAHVSHITPKHDDISYVIQKGEKDIYSAIESALFLSGDWNLFAMPDTYYPLDIFSRVFKMYPMSIKHDYDFILGLFPTTNPERFGILKDGEIINKQELPPSLYNAWGTIVWSRRVAEFWKRTTPKSYTFAFNNAMKTFRWNIAVMDYYYDMATWEDYREFIGNKDAI
jgi:dTDP-glucose pyrophosphorylase